VNINQVESLPDDFEEEETEDSEKEVGEESLPVHASVTIEKPSKGALSIDITAQDGTFMVNNVFYYKDSKLANDRSADADGLRQALYLGPEFEDLDEDLQVLFERYLEERGINTALALFISYYAEYKEQKEYENWLSGVKDFVEA